jgi:hypothetical protein
MGHVSDVDDEGVENGLSGKRSRSRWSVPSTRSGDDMVDEARDTDEMLDCDWRMGCLGPGERGEAPEAAAREPAVRGAALRTSRASRASASASSTGVGGKSNDTCERTANSSFWRSSPFLRSASISASSEGTERSWLDADAMRVTADERLSLRSSRTVS